MSAPEGVSFVIPVHNGERWLAEVLGAVAAQDDGRPMEVIVVDDASSDGSAAIIHRYAATRSTVRVLSGAGRGAAAAINLGVEAAKFPIICQLDHDVIPHAGWMAHLLAAFDSPTVAAAQGYYTTDPRSSGWARVMGRELEQRYGRIHGRFVNHVCTGNTAYRAEALRRLGGFDESMGYGYDNDMSYRLTAAGYQLAFCREATAIHRWREDVAGYVKQQYGFGYGRLDLVAKHRRFAGDDVSGLSMMLHAPLLLCAIAGGAMSAALALAGGPWRAPLVVTALILIWLVGERLAAGLLAWRRFGDPVGLWFAPAHLLRDVAWVAAIGVWTARRFRGRARSPSQSMPKKAET